MLCFRASRPRLLVAAALVLVSGITPVRAQAPAATEVIHHQAPPDAGVVPFPRVQLIHVAHAASTLDVYVDGQRILDDVQYETATPFLPLLWGTHTVDLVAAADKDNSAPLSTSTIMLRPHGRYALVVMGTTPRPNVLLIDDLRAASSVPDQIEYVLVHAAPDAPALDVRLLDPLQNNAVIALLANNLEFGEFRGYWRLRPAGYNFEMTSADNRVVLAVNRLELQALGGQTIFLLVIPGGSIPVQLMGVEASGDIFFQSIISTEDADAVPGALTLRGNHPNPFNPATMITFDLPEAATIHLDVFDLLGRAVLTTPAQQRPAGAGQTLAVDASALASGVYAYRVVAQTTTRRHVQTGQMVLAR